MTDDVGIGWSMTRIVYTREQIVKASTFWYANGKSTARALSAMGEIEDMDSTLHIFMKIEDYDRGRAHLHHSDVEAIEEGRKKSGVFEPDRSLDRYAEKMIPRE